MMKATVNEDLCIGCGLCETVCPQVFKLNEDNISEVMTDPVPSDAEGAVQNACDGCPVEAIALAE